MVKRERPELLRREVYAYLAGNRRASILIRQLPLQKWLLLLFTLLLLLTVFALTQVRYRETESAPGILVGASGVQRVVAPAAGIIQKVEVIRGQAVKQGDVLAVLDTTRLSASGVPIHLSAMEELRARQDRLLRESEIQALQHESGQRQLLAAMAQAGKKSGLLAAEEVLLIKQLAIANDAEQALHELFQTAAIPRMQYEQARAARLELERQLQQLKILLADNFTRQQELQAQSRELEVEAERFSLNQQGRKAEIEQSLQQLREQQAVAVVANGDGIISEAVAMPGFPVRPGENLFYIGNPDEVLRADIYVPSRIAGKLASGQQVLFRYDPYPFQEFGRFDGVITSIGQARLDPRNVLLPIPGIVEPVYRVEARLAQQSNKSNQLLHLQPETRLVADFIMDEMSLLEFVLQPFLKMRGKVQWNALQDGPT